MNSDRDVSPNAEPMTKALKSPKNTQALRVDAVTVPESDPAALVLELKLATHQLCIKDCAKTGKHSPDCYRRTRVLKAHGGA